MTYDPGFTTHTAFDVHAAIPRDSIGIVFSNVARTVKCPTCGAEFVTECGNKKVTIRCTVCRAERRKVVQSRAAARLKARRKAARELAPKSGFGKH